MVKNEQSRVQLIAFFSKRLRSFLRQDDNVVVIIKNQLFGIRRAIARLYGNLLSNVLRFNTTHCHGEERTISSAVNSVLF